MGKLGRSAIATLVERQSRFTVHVGLSSGRQAHDVRDALAEAILDLPAELCQSLTWVQGKEMAEHAKLTDETGVNVCFCDPRSPWQSGTNENTMDSCGSTFLAARLTSQRSTMSTSTTWRESSMAGHELRSAGERQPKF